MADPSNFADWANYPSDEVLEVKRSLIRSFFAKVINKIKATPESWSGKGGEVIVSHNDETGPVPASLSDVEFVDFSQLPVRNFKAGTIPLAASDNLTDNEHSGGLIVATNSSSATLTVALNADPALGVSDLFQCEVLRHPSASSLTIVAGTGLTLSNPDSHTKVVAGGVARLQVVGSLLYFLGYTES